MDYPPDNSDESMTTDGKTGGDDCMEDNVIVSNSGAVTTGAGDVNCNSTVTADELVSSQLDNNASKRSLTPGSCHVEVFGAESVSVTAKDDGRNAESQKTKEREERVRLARERREQAELKRLDDLRESMARQQDARKRQEEERRRKIEEMKKREQVHRNNVEERRRRLQNEEKRRKEAIVRRNAERDARLELLRPSRRSVVMTAFGGSVGHIQTMTTVDNSTLRRSAFSVRDISVNVMSAEDVGSTMKQLSMSTSHLGASHRSVIKDSSLKSVTCTDDSECSHVQSCVAQGAVTNGDARRRRPHSLVCGGLRQPGYAADTVSSRQLRVGAADARSDAVVSDGARCHVVCSRYRSVSPRKGGGRAHSSGPVSSGRRSRADGARSSAHVSQQSPTADAQHSATATGRAAAAAAAASSRMSQSLSRVKSVPGKLNTDPKTHDTTPSAVSSTRGRTPSAKRTSKSTATTPTTGPMSKPMPVAPKSMAPRMVPKEPKEMKDVTTGNSVAATSRKVVVAKSAGKDNTDTKDDGMQATSVHILEDTVSKNTAAATAESVATVVEASSSSSACGVDEVKKVSTEEEDYKMKLAENRRVAREKAEREHAEEAARLEQQRRDEDEAKRREEEAERQREDEELKLAAEARRLEAERFQRAVEQEERRRQEEEERTEMERLEKEKADKLAQEETDRKDRERVEKARRDEEERLERKKKLEMIMKRVKTDDASLQKLDCQSSPSASIAEDLNKDISSLTTDRVPRTNDTATSQFRSPLLRQMMSAKLSTTRPAEDDALTAARLASVESTVPPTTDDDLVAMCDESLEPSPRLQTQLGNLRDNCTVTDSPLDLSPRLADDRDDLAANDIPLCPSEGLVDTAADDTNELTVNFDEALVDTSCNGVQHPSINGLSSDVVWIGEKSTTDHSTVFDQVIDISESVSSASKPPATSAPIIAFQ